MKAEDGLLAASFHEIRLNYHFCILVFHINLEGCSDGFLYALVWDDITSKVGDTTPTLFITGSLLIYHRNVGSAMFET